ncbi:uncharacterized protein LOC124413860 [Diprion similis]|uniref:uncharacterized protein LOC124413860 n=1 Tax=Diprion similis TaxID=362088 RepID=UPI001EF800AC|nr:uncharacterized protein LOC124413860 [Diprion similis]
MTSHAGQNKGYKRMLIVFDIYSKYAWAVPIKSKSGDDVTKAMESVLAQGRMPKKLHVDRGTEFYYSKFESLIMQGSCKWLKMLSDLVSAYNNSKHRTIGIKRSNVTVANERLVLRQSYGGLCKTYQTGKFQNL